MKKTVQVMLMTFLLLLITACVPEGMDSDFYYDAIEIFDELDDDTMEGEKPDRDDIMNYKLFLENYNLKSQAEKEVVKNLDIMFKENEKIVEDYDAPLNNYLKARKNVLNALERSVPEFKFIED